MMSTNEINNDVKIYDVPDDITIKHDNITDLYKLEDPYKYRMYDVPQNQMDDGGAKCTVTNNINLLKNVQRYN